MGDLVLQRQSRLIEFLQANGPATTRAIIDRFEWPSSLIREELERLQYRRLIQSRTSGADVEWMAID